MNKKPNYSQDHKILMKASKVDLVELIEGFKPEEEFVNEVQITGIFPASQFHYECSDTITENQKKAILESFKNVVFGGFIDAQIFSRRVIVTTACSALERPHWAVEYAHAISIGMDANR